MDEGRGNNALTSEIAILKVYIRTISCNCLSNQFKPLLAIIDKYGFATNE